MDERIFITAYILRGGEHGKAEVVIPSPQGYGVTKLEVTFTPKQDEKISAFLQPMVEEAVAAYRTTKAVQG